MKVRVNAPCCVCGTSASTELFETEYPQFGYPGTFVVRRCRCCGLLFNSPRLTDEEIGALYDNHYYFFQRSDEREFRRIEDMYQRIIVPIEHTVSAKRVLEIGSAKGYLLAVMKRLGWDVMGVEISRDAAGYARRKFGIDSFVGTLEEFAASAAQAVFPLVLAIDVIEHVVNPNEFVASLRRVLTDDGILVIDTPNGNSYNISVRGSEWKGFNPFHIFLFSKNNITRLLKKNGFVVEKVFSYGNSPEEEHSQPDTMRFVSPASDLPGGPGATIKEVLKKAHLFEPCLRIRDVMLAWHRFVCKTDLKRAINNARHCVDYFQTPDSTGPLSKECRGDNIVVLAKKTCS